MQKQEQTVGKAGLIWRFLKGSKTMFVVSMLMAALMALADMITPQIIRAAVDNAIGGNPPEFGPAVMKLVNAFGGFEYLGKHLWIMALAVVVVAAVVADVISGSLDDRFVLSVQNGSLFLLRQRLEVI
jgi:ABC-type multidrug transport system fused ATPase/permease subunit